MTKLKNKEKFFSIPFLAGTGIYFILIVIINIFHFNYQMNSDIASDVILSELICKSKEIIPSTWYIATETRIICTPNIAALWGNIINNMTMTTGLACCTMTVLIVISVFYFSKLTNLNSFLSSMLSFLCIALPCNMTILELLYLFASYYAIHIIIFFVTLAVYAESINTRKLKWTRPLLCIILAFILGLQGVRGILLIYGPLFGIEILRNIYFLYQKQKGLKKDALITLWAFLLLSLSFLGTCFPTSVGQDLSRNIRKGIPKFFTVVIPDMGRAAGLENAGFLGRLCLIIFLLTALYVLIHILLRMWKKEFVTPIEWAWLVVCSSPVITALIVSFTTVESTPRYYFTLPFLMAFSTVLLYKWSLGKQKIILLAVMALFAILNIFQVYLPVIRTEEPPASDEFKVTEFLDENHYQTAYASFESANKMTVLSNGRVRVYPVATVEKMDICKWMTSTDWYCPNMPFEAKTAYIITESETKALNQFLIGKEDFVREIEKIGKYYIYVSDYNYSNLGEE